MRNANLLTISLTTLAVLTKAAPPVAAQVARTIDDAALKNAGKYGAEWTTYGFTPGETRYSPLAKINA
jgi:glucose dehydrogenase